jgi:HAD superfamily hydrolase (TIGR01509 family)
MSHKPEHFIIPDVIKGLIFDCDGTLVDSMPQHMKSWELAFRSFREPYREEFLLSVKGMEEREIVDVYNRTFSTSLDGPEVVRKKHEYFGKMIKNITPIQAVVDVVLNFRGKKPMAVVSGGTRKNVLAELKTVNILDCFDIVLTADDPIPPKPAPDILLTAAEKIKTHPSQCLVFEDADLGIKAARKAGMKVVDIRKHLKNPMDPESNRGHK